MDFVCHAGGGFFDFGEFFFVLYTLFEFTAEADGFADIDPVIRLQARHIGDAGFAICFEEILPDFGDGEIVEIPEFALVSGAVGGLGGVAGVDRAGFAVFVEKIGEADFEIDIFFFEIVLEILFVFDDGVFEGDTVGTDEVGIDDKMILGVWTTHGHPGIPGFFFGDWGLGSGTSDNASNNKGKYDDNSSADKAVFDDFIHEFSFSSLDIFHL